MVTEQPKWQPTREQIIENKFGKETMQDMEEISQGIFAMIKQRLLEIGMGEGSTNEQRAEAKEYLEMWKGFANNLFAATASDNAKSPERVKTAIDGAAALMAPTGKGEHSEAAERMIVALEKRYGK